MVPNSITQNFSQIEHMDMTVLTFSCNPNPNPSTCPMHNPDTLIQYFTIKILDRCRSHFVF